MKKALIGLMAAAFVTGSFATPSFASGNAQSGPTVGNCMSDILYGNEPNMRNNAPGGPAEQTPGTQAGNVVPSQSPGPFVNTGANEPPRNDRTRGRSAGQWNQEGVNIPALCRAAFSPSN